MIPGVPPEAPEPAHVPFAEIASPAMSAFVAYWESLRGEAFAPAWADFNLWDLDPKSIPNVVVTEVLHEPLDFLVRFWGTGHVRRKGYDKTGRTLSGSMARRGGRPYAEHAWVVREKKLMAVRDLVDLREFNRTMPFWQHVVRLPLSSDGELVDYIVSLAEWDKA